MCSARIGFDVVSVCTSYLILGVTLDKLNYYFVEFCKTLSETRMIIVEYRRVVLFLNLETFEKRLVTATSISSALHVLHFSGRGSPGLTTATTWISKS